MPLNNKRPNKPRKKIDLQYKDSSISQQYGYIKAAVGGCTFTVELLNKEEKLCSVKGVLKKRAKLRVGDLVLVEPLTDSENGRYMIMFRYTQDHKNILEKEGHLRIVDNEEKKDKNEDEEAYTFDEGTPYKAIETKANIDEDFIDLI
jgi:initiation factor 1A